MQTAQLVEGSTEEVSAHKDQLISEEEAIARTNFSPYELHELIIEGTIHLAFMENKEPMYFKHEIEALRQKTKTLDEPEPNKTMGADE